MKSNILTLLCATLIALAAILPASAQRAGSPFKGVINYKITYPDSKVEPSQLAMMPQTVKLTTNGNKSRIELNMASMNQVMLMDADEETTIMLLEIAGNKVMMKPNKGNNSQKGKEPVVKVTSETKEIAGYKCKKAEITYGDEKSEANPIIVYFTDDIGNNKLFYDNEYRTLPGIPMEFSYKMQGMNMFMTATSVEKDRVPNSAFEVPSDYKEMTPDQLRQMFGGGAGK